MTEDHSLTPAQLAELDAAHAAGVRDLLHMVEAFRAAVAGGVDPTVEAMRLTLYLSEAAPHRIAAGFAALAIARLAQQEVTRRG